MPRRPEDVRDHVVIRLTEMMQVTGRQGGAPPVFVRTYASLCEGHPRPPEGLPVPGTSVAHYMVVARDLSWGEAEGLARDLRLLAYVMDS